MSCTKNGRLILRGKEYSSSIYTTAIDGKKGYTYTNANEGSNDHSKHSDPPNGKKIKAIIHSHGKYEEGYDNNNFNNGDKWVYYNNGVDGYVATPDGSLKKYDVETTQVTNISTLMPSDPKDPERKNLIKPTDVPAQESATKNQKSPSQNNKKEEHKKYK